MYLNNIHEYDNNMKKNASLKVKELIFWALLIN